MVPSETPRTKWSAKLALMVCTAAVRCSGMVVRGVPLRGARGLRPRLGVVGAGSVAGRIGFLRGLALRCSSFCEGVGYTIADTIT